MAQWQWKHKIDLSIFSLCFGPCFLHFHKIHQCCDLCSNITLHLFLCSHRKKVPIQWIKCFSLTAVTTICGLVPGQIDLSYLCNIPQIVGSSMHPHHNTDHSSIYSHISEFLRCAQSFESSAKEKRSLYPHVQLQTFQKPVLVHQFQI